MSNQHVQAVCPACGATLELEIDDEGGIPDGISAECECGAVPGWVLLATTSYRLGPYLGDQRREGEQASE